MAEATVAPEPTRRLLSTPKLAGVIVGAWLVPQIVAIFAVPGVAEGSAFDSGVQGFLQLEIIPDFGAALIAIWMIVRLGWVDEIRHESFGVNRWVWSVPIVMIAMSAATTDYANLVDAGIGYVLLLVVATFFTGVSEELLFRGLALQSFRDRHREWVAGALSSVFFGLFHLVNIVTAGPTAIFQAVWAVTAGYLLYLCRRVGGGMVLPIVVHWVWDFASFSPVLRDEGALAGGRALLMFLTTVALMIAVLVKRRSIPASPPDEMTVSRAVTVGATGE